jgi:hypothetical protein
MSILKPLHVPRSAAEREAMQLTLERMYLWSLAVFMGIAAATFLAAPNRALYSRFSSDLHLPITPTFFCVLCVGGALLALALYRFRDRLDVVWKRQLALLCLSGLALYTVAVGVYAALTGMNSFSVVVYILFLLPWVQLSFAVYRE